MEVDFNLLNQDVKFPLSWDTDEYKMYIFDSNMGMIAQVDIDNIDATEEEHPFEMILGNEKVNEHLPENTFFFLDNGDFYDRRSGRRIGLVRGWGRLKKKSKPETRQDNVGNYILQCLNKELR